MPERPATEGRSRIGPRREAGHGQRRELLRAGRGDLGAARGYETVFGVILGTGVGGGIVVDGKVLNGCHGIASTNGAKSSSIPTAPSPTTARKARSRRSFGPALERFYAEQSGQTRKLKEIAERAGSDSAAKATPTPDRFLRESHRHAIIDVLDPHAIVLGGGVGNIDALYTDETRKKIVAAIFNPRFEAALLKPVSSATALEFLARRCLWFHRVI